MHKAKLYLTYCELTVVRHMLTMIVNRPELRA